MTLGAMQPYLFPYLAFFQLISCVDIYLFCGNVQYMKHGWINRNRILVNVKNKETHYFTFSVEKDDYRKSINQRRYSNLKEDCDKLKRNLLNSYRRASNFEEAYCVIEEIMKFPDDNVANFNMNAAFGIARYLGIETLISCTDMIMDTVFWDHFYQLEYEERMVYICKYFNADGYVNAIGGLGLYHRKFFEDNNISLGFIKMDEDIEYPQFGGEFIPNLSIIDVIMHNKVEDVKALLRKCQIVDSDSLGG